MIDIVAGYRLRSALTSAACHHRKNGYVLSHTMPSLLRSRANLRQLYPLLRYEQAYTHFLSACMPRDTQQRVLPIRQAFHISFLSVPSFYSQSSFSSLHSFYLSASKYSCRTAFASGTNAMAPQQCIMPFPICVLSVTPYLLQVS